MLALRVHRRRGCTRARAALPTNCRTDSLRDRLAAAESPPRARVWALGRCRSWQRLLMEADLPQPPCLAAWLGPPPAATRSNSAVAARSRRRLEAQPSLDGPGCCAEQAGSGGVGPGMRSAAPTHYKAAKFCINVCQQATATHPKCVPRMQLGQHGWSVSMSRAALRGVPASLVTRQTTRMRHARSGAATRGARARGRAARGRAVTRRCRSARACSRAHPARSAARASAWAPRRRCTSSAAPARRCRRPGARAAALR